MSAVAALGRALAFGLCVFGTSCASAPTATPSEGVSRVQVREDAAANAALEEARTRSPSGGTPAESVEALLAVRKRYPESTAGQQALYEAGVLAYAQGDFATARRVLKELLYENPTFPAAHDAQEKLAFASLESGASQDAYQGLWALSQREEDAAKKAQLLEAAEQAAVQGGLWGEALRLALGRVEEAKGEAEKKEALDRVVERVEGQVPFVEVARAQAELSTDSPAWPVLTFKLARIAYHLRDWPRLTQTLEQFLRTAPRHPYAAQAEELLARAHRRSEVNPKALGVVLPLSGKYKPLGEAVMRGLNLAFAGSQLELVVKDSQGDVTLAGKAVEELAFDQHVMAIMGPLLGDDAERAALVAEELEVPILTLTRQEDITRIGRYVFRNMLTNRAQAAALADYATRQMGYKSFAVLYPNIPYGVELANGFWDEVLQRGGQVRGAESYEHDQTTFTEEAKKLVGRYYLEDRLDYVEQLREAQTAAQDADSFRKRKAVEKVKSKLEPIIDFDALFIPDDWRKVGLVAPALAVEDIITNACDPKDLERIRKTTGKKDLKTVTLLGANGWSSPKGRDGVPELVTRGGKFVTCAIYVDGFYPESERPATRRFVARYRETYRNLTDPGLLEATAYDSGGMMRELLEKNPPTTRLELRDRLERVRDYNGATGQTSFNREREAVKPLFFLTIDAQGVKELEAAKPARAKEES